MVKTRSTKTAVAASTTDDAASAARKYVLPQSSSNSPQVFVLPRAATADARIVTLPNPRYSKPTRYLVCPETGVYEFTKIAAPKSTPRSWLIETFRTLESETKAKSDTSGQVSKEADLYVATAVDPLFLLLPSLVDPASPKSSESRRLFLCSDDYFDKLPSDMSHLSEILCWSQVRKVLEGRIEAVCDAVDAGDEKMFRINEQKLLQEMVAKAKRMSEPHLPDTMEEKFVRKALEAPILFRKREPGAFSTEPSSAGKAASSEVSTPLTESDSQSSVATTDSAATSISQASTAPTSVADESQDSPIDNAMSSVGASGKVVALQRLRVAFDFICSAYVPPSLARRLQELLADQSTSTVDFGPLNEYLTSLTKLRAEAMAARGTDDYSLKRGHDEEEDEGRQEKKRKIEEEKRKKAQESRGVRDLKKVNTAGMKKLSEFFKKK